MKTALITGASSGIGESFAYIFAKNAFNTVLVARSEDKLNEIASKIKHEYNINAKVVSADLSKPNSPKELYDRMKAENIDIDFLINNAGFGDKGMFYDTNWEKENTMINLNINSLTHMTKLFVKDMIKRGSGRILNVASTGAFQPCPHMSVYCATKSYVLSFSQGINNELRKKGITVTALCPGATRTGFAKTAGNADSKLFQGNIPSPEQVASYGYKALMKGKSVATHGFKNQFLAFITRFMPRNFVTNISGNMMK